MHKSRFPGKSVNKHPRREVSYRDLPPGFLPSESCPPHIASEYRDSMARLILELPELRQRFGFPIMEEFHGFRPDDGIHTTCKNKQSEISSIVSSLETRSKEEIKQRQQQTSVVSSSNSAEAVSVAEVVQGTTEVTTANGDGKKKASMNVNVSRQSKSRRGKRKRSVSAEGSKKTGNGTNKTKVIKTENSNTSGSQLNSVSDPFKTPIKAEETAVVVSTVECPTEIVLTCNKDLTKQTTEAKMIPSVNSKCTVMKQEAKVSTDVASVQPEIAFEFFKDKEDYASAVSVFVNSKLHPTEYYESFIPERGWIQCGVCLDMTESSTLSQQKQHGIFMCLKCIGFLNRMMGIAQKNEPYSCKAKGACDIVPNEDYCEACFVRTCLLSLDLKDETYFKMWRSVPPKARNYVPTKPPVVKRYPNRGKVLFVDFKTGVIVKSCSHVTSNVCKTENSSNIAGSTALVNPAGYELKKIRRRGATATKVKQPAALSVDATDKRPKVNSKDLPEIKSATSSCTTSSSVDQTLLNRVEDKVVKVVCPLHSYEPEEQGYAVVVPEGETPPKPLCFVCGSAGIRQLIFCSGCCEPFHPYCSEDELLLSAFIAELSEESASLQLLSVPSTSRLTKFRRWRCYRCALCKLCNKTSSNRTSETKDTSMIKCSACLDSYHYSCARKVSSGSMCKPAEVGKWVCHNCLKCTSCGLKLSKSLQHHYRKLSTDSCKSNEEREVLCLECFKRRKNKSYCPVCYVCYDDNDWDSKMMECEKCSMWVHSNCEGLSDEKYSVLSLLPESIPYVCRLCTPFEVEVGWRLAVKHEISDGFSKVLGYFQKKTVGMSRKRRALTFDEDSACSNTEPFFAPSDINCKPVQDQTETITCESVVSLTQSSPPPSLSTTNDKSISVCTSVSISATVNHLSREKLDQSELECKYSNLIVKYKIKKCSVRLKDLDSSNRHPHRNKRSSPRLSKKVDNADLRAADVALEMQPIIPLERCEILLKTPEKNPASVCGEIGRFAKLLSFDFLTPTKLSTPTRIVVSFTDEVRKITERSSEFPACTVHEFYVHCMSLIPTFFQEIDNTSTERHEGYFKDTMKQVFSWFDTSKVEYKKSESNTGNVTDQIALSDEPSTCEVDGDPEQISVTEPSDEDVYHDCIILEDLYWDQEKFLDFRVCSFCAEIGDFPTHSCGRLLYAGPGDWVHVNCAIWSSEIWEEDNGSLQQVEIALTRSKRTKCGFCEEFGASLNCCASSCKLCFHFYCAIVAGCFLMEDKTMFCAGHEANAKGSIQKDMHVTRKVFVDLDASRKKDLKILSSKAYICIGSMRVARLGYIVPISINGSKNLVPVGYKSQRIHWATKYEQALQLYTTQSSLNTEGDFRAYFENLNESKVEPFSITVNQSNRRDYKTMLRKLDEFGKWIKTAPVYIDEYKNSWEMPCYPAVFQSYLRGNGLMQNGLKMYFTKKVHTAEINLNLTVEDYCLFSTESTVSGNNGLNNNKPSSQPQFSGGIYSGVLWNPTILRTPKSFEDEYLAFIDKAGLAHPAITFITEQLPGVEGIVGEHRFRHGRPHVAPEDVPVKISDSGSVRTDGFCSRKPFDRFGWLASKHRYVPASKMNFEETVKSKGLPIAMRFRNLKERSNKDLVVLSSHIHGRGLFARRDIESGEMLIEYAGEVIRSSLCDMREKKYEDEGMGCYMFRINRDLVVDATMKGNAARFINHSCDPNCESKCVKILGKDHILIFALKNIGRGEELTYDYKFDRESDKLPCTCNSKKCRKFLN